MIDHGHDQERLLHSTYAQIFMWQNEHILLDVEKRLNQMRDIRMAFNGSADDFGKAIRALESVL